MKELSSLNDRLRRPFSPEPGKKQKEDIGPFKPDIERPKLPNELLRRMKQIDPDQAKRYRQRSGE
jgi:hypothetical protein